MRDYRDVIIRPILTEKSMRLMDNGNKFTFEVAKNADKVEIRNAVEHLFNVKVESVNTINVPAKVIRRGRYTGKTNAVRKAIVTLAEGDTIRLFNDEEA